METELIYAWYRDVCSQLVAAAIKAIVGRKRRRKKNFNTFHNHAGI
jgi:hypothetical protein